ncbi:hypothetical protein JOF56_003687 [Kibdelosporangium banguiense]|uniref:DUF1059 domain-containing protein n=1 Tax=Kibdelosporangium banguiense TaxID=1365924 RepID=A0ABS4TFV7_9PSEU|nr:hypothetical protein [Kibdelosporangium banguiense]MBP2323302.1 hypothetical protein [Kibdelosporangium banguiense]
MAWPASRNDATGLPLIDWRCSCGAADVGFGVEDEARDDAEKHLGDADPSEPAGVPPARLRELAAFLEDLAESGRFWMPNSTDGERKAGGQALADTAARIEKLITEGTFN